MTPISEQLPSLFRIMWPLLNSAQIGLFISSSQQACEGILGNGPAARKALSLESSSLVLGDCNSISYSWSLLGTVGAMAVTTQHSHLPRKPSLRSPTVLRNQCGNKKSNRFPHLLVLRPNDGTSLSHSFLVCKRREFMCLLQMILWELLFFIVSKMHFFGLFNVPLRKKKKTPTAN